MEREERIGINHGLPTMMVYNMWSLLTTVFFLHTSIYCILWVSGVTNLTNKHPFPQANCLQILVESPSILSLQIFATGPTFERGTYRN
jgi:hypothetical protein